MGPFTRRRPQTLSDQLLYYALSNGTPKAIAECFAEDVTERGVQHLPGGAFNLTSEWQAWATRNLTTCPACGSPWAIFVPCVSAWECWKCRWSQDAEAS